MFIGRSEGVSECEEECLMNWGYRKGWRSILSSSVHHVTALSLRFYIVAT